jgi:hypothetical protein
VRVVLIMAHICEVKAEYKISVEEKGSLEDLVIDGGIL